MASTLKIGVLSLQGAVSEHVQHLAQCGEEAVEVRGKRDLERLDGLVIPGGESTTIGFLMNQAHLLDSVKSLCRDGMPVMGTCAGMVMLARDIEDGKPEQPRLGLMDITVKRNAFGRQKESFEAWLEFKGIDVKVPGVFIRAPLVTQTGDNVEVLARLQEGPVAVRRRNMLALSFHPELTEDLSVHRFFLDLCRMTGQQ